MASTLFQVRSESLPSRPHPIMTEIDDRIRRLRSDSEATLSCSSVVNQLTGLQDLHDSIDEMLLLPLAQQLLAQQNNKKWVEELLDGSLRVLDVCSAAKDALLQSKEYALQLESTIRRRSPSSNIDGEISKYLTSRKMAKKAIQKAYNNLKSLESKSMFTSISNDNEIAGLVGILREVQAVTLIVLKSFMCFVNGRRIQSGGNKWSVVSKLMIQKRIECDQESEANNAFAKADAALESMVGCKDSKEMENVQTVLKDLEVCIQHLEDGSHNLFRRMIKTRVSFLNIIN